MGTLTGCVSLEVLPSIRRTGMLNVCKSSVNVSNLPAAINHPVHNSAPQSTSNATVTKLPNGTIAISCSDKGVDCVALLLNSSDPSRLEVIGVMNGDVRTVLFSPVTFDGMHIAVLTWERSQSILAGQLSFVSKLKSSKSVNMYWVIVKVRYYQSLYNYFQALV